MKKSGQIKKAFGFLIIIIALAVVGIEFILSIMNSYGAQIERRVNNFRRARVIYNDTEDPLIKKIVKFDAHGMITADALLYRIIRRRSETGTGSGRDEAVSYRSGTSGGGGQEAQGNAEQPVQENVTSTPAAGLNDNVKNEINELYKKQYGPNQDEINKFKTIVDSLTDEENAKILKMAVSLKISQKSLFMLENDLLKAISNLFTILDDNQKKIFITDSFDYEWSTFNADKLQKLKTLIEFAKSAEMQEKKYVVSSSKFEALSNLIAQEEDVITAALKFLVEKEIADANRMRFLEKPLFKFASWAVTIIFLLGCICFIFKMDLARIFVMFFGIIKIAFLFTIPLSMLGFITNVIVLLSVISIILTFVSMYIVDLRPKKA